MEEKISNRVINTDLLELGSTYILQYQPNFSYLGELIKVDKRHSVNIIEVEAKNKKGTSSKIKEKIIGTPQYDILFFKSEMQKSAERSACISRMFDNTLSIKDQFYFTNSIIFEQNLIKEEVHDWAISKMIDVHGSVISNKNLDVTIKIAISMMKKKGYFDSSIRLIIDKIKEKSINIIDINQYEWSKVLEFQANQLPF